MANLNTTYLMGNLTANPEMRYTPSGTAVAEFAVAAHRRLRSGEDEVLFMPVTVWGKTAENCSRYLAKGSSILVVGFLRQETWKTQDGQRRSTIKLVAEDVQFLPRAKQPPQNQQQGQPPPTPQPDGHRYKPEDAAPPQPAQPPAQQDMQPYDDIPF